MATRRFKIQVFLFAVLIAVACETIVWSSIKLSLQESANTSSSTTSASGSTSTSTTGSRVTLKSEAQTIIDRAAVSSSTTDPLQIKVQPLSYLERQERTCSVNNSNNNNNNINTTLAVAIFPHNCTGICGVLSHFFTEGVDYSTCLIRTNDYLHAPVWLVDAHRVNAETLLDALKEREEQRLNLGMVKRNNDSAAIVVPHLTIYHVDYGDHPIKTNGGLVADYHQSLVENDETNSSTTANANTTRFTVKYYKRSIVENRTMGPSFQNESLGSIHTYPYKMNHIPYGVRTDLVEVFNSRILELLGHSIRHQNTSMISSFTPLHPSMVEHLRIHGVRSFWPAQNPNTDKLSSPLQQQQEQERKCQNLEHIHTFWCHIKHTLFPVWSPQKNNASTTTVAPSLDPHFFSSNFRCHVSQTLLDFSNELERNGTATSLRSSPYNIVEPFITVGLTGEAAGVGRAIPQLTYVYDLLSYKIIVVCQRDEWEGHYRLMEAMMGGGLVLHDVMLAPPSRLLDGVHYVIYHSMTDLVAKVMYYLTHEEERRAIANRGWKQAMTHYRSWNLVEAMILDHMEMV